MCALALVLSTGDNLLHIWSMHLVNPQPHSTKRQLFLPAFVFAYDHPALIGLYSGGVAYRGVPIHLFLSPSPFHTSVLLSATEMCWGYSGASLQRQPHTQKKGGGCTFSDELDRIVCKKLD